MIVNFFMLRIFVGRGTVENNLNLKRMMLLNVRLVGIGYSIRKESLILKSRFNTKPYEELECIINIFK